MKKTYFTRENLNSFLAFTLAIIVSAINFNLLLKPLNLVTGGAGGLGLVLGNILPLSISNIITIIYFATFLLGLIFLDKKTVFGIIYASVLYPLIVHLTENISLIFTFSYQDVFLVCIISGIISGITNGTIFQYGLSAGGLSVIPLILNKKFKISISMVNFIVNTIVVLLGAYFYGFNLVLYAIILLYINSYICNNVILGSSKNKVMFIKSKKENQIIRMLYEKYQISATFLDGEDISLLVVMRNLDYLKIKKDLLKIDKTLFFTTNDCYEVGK